MDAFFVTEDGTKEYPILVWQTGYGCHHAEINPKPEAGQYYKRVGFLDTHDLCPDCLAKKKAKAAARKMK